MPFRLKDSDPFIKTPELERALKTRVGRRLFLKVGAGMVFEMITIGAGNRFTNRTERIGNPEIRKQVKADTDPERWVRLFPGEEIYVRYPTSNLLFLGKLSLALGSFVLADNPLDLDGDGKITTFDIVIASQGYNKEPTHLYAHKGRGRGVDFLQLTFVSPTNLCGWNIDVEGLFNLFSRCPQWWPGLQQPVRLEINVVTMIRGGEIVNPRQSAVFRDPSSGCLALVLTLRDLKHPRYRNNPMDLNLILMEQLLESLKGERLIKEEKQKVPPDILTLPLPLNPPSKPLPGWSSQPLQHV